MPYKVTKNKTKVSCSKLKRTAVKKAKALRAGGSKKVRITKVKSCSKTRGC